MTRTELIVRTQERLPEMSFQQVSACCGALLETLFDALADGRNVTLPRLGEFKIKQHRARVAVIRVTAWNASSPPALWCSSTRTRTSKTA